MAVNSDLQRMPHILLIKVSLDTIGPIVMSAVGLVGLAASLFLYSNPETSGEASLASTPLSTSRLEALVQIQSEANETISAEALRLIHGRDARNEEARLWLAFSALEQNNIIEFLQLYIPLFDIDGRDAETYASTLAALARDERIRLAVDAVLENQPRWGLRYLRALLDNSLQPLRALESSFEHIRSAQPIYLNRMLRSGNAQEAYTAFKRFAATGSKFEVSVPYDPTFSGSDAPAPFNWTYDRARVEFEPGTGAIANFFGRNRPRLLNQIVPLEAPTYQFTAEMSGYASLEWGRFAWTLTCLDSGVNLLERVPVELSTNREIFETRFDVPKPSCGFARLSLEGRAGTFPRSVQANVHRIGLVAFDGETEE